MTTIDKTFDGDKKNFKNNCEGNRVTGFNPQPPPPPPPSPLPGEYIDAGDIMHISSHIPLYEGNEDPG